MDSPPDSDETGGAWRYERADRAARNRPWRRVLRVVRRHTLAPLVPLTAPLLLRGLSATWRVSTTRGELRDEVLQGPDGCIAVLWHGRMAAAAPIFRGVDATILVSPSGDGDLAETLLGRLGYRTLRGSTGKASVEAIRELRARLERGGTIALTPDGPRGPRHRVNRGAAFLARATGRPVLPIGFAAAPAKHLSSWDRFTVPKPGARVHVSFGDPIPAPARLDDAEHERFGAEVRRRLVDAETEAHARLGVEVDW